MTVERLLRNLTANRYFLRLDQCDDGELRWSLMYMTTFVEGLPETAYLEQVAWFVSVSEATSYLTMLTAAHAAARTHAASIGMGFALVAGEA